jgi:hypothetical protein
VRFEPYVATAPKPKRKVPLLAIKDGPAPPPPPPPPPPLVSVARKRQPKRPRNEGPLERSELDLAHKLRQPPAPGVPAAPAAVHVAVAHLRTKVQKADVVTAAIKAVRANAIQTTGGSVDGKRHAMRAALSHALRLVAKRQADNDMDQVAMDKIGMSIADMELPRKKRPPPAGHTAAKTRRPPPPALVEKGKKGGGIRAALATRMTRA